MKRALVIFFFLVFYLNNSSQQLSVSGYIKDEVTKELLIGATVYDFKTNQGTTTDHNGYFNISYSKGDTANLVISYVGYEKQYIKRVVESSFSISVLLKFNSVLKTAIIEGEIKKEESPEISVISIPLEQSKKMPTIFGESDIIRNYQLMPGVSGGKEATSGLFVRGGSPDQNLFLLDNIPVYNIGHIGGFLSVFDANAINSVKLYKGGFPARFGGRLSSVVDIRMKDGNKNKTKKDFSIGTLSTKFSIEGPIKKDTSSYFLSFRRCNVDLFTRVASLFDSDFESMAGYTFWDAYGKFNRILKDKSTLSFNFYAGRDNIFINTNSKAQYEGDYDLKYRSTINWGNIVGSLNYAKELSPFLFGNASLGYTQYTYRTKAKAKVRNQGESSYSDDSELSFISGIRDLMLKTNLNYYKFNNHSVKSGVNLIFHSFTPGNSFYSQVGADFEEQKVVTNVPAFESQVYVEDTWTATPRLVFLYGLHFVSYTIQNSTFNSLQPRANVNFMLTESLSIKGSYVKMNQSTHLLSTSGAGLPSDLWIPATKNNIPEQSNQATIGFAHTTKNKIEISLEGYYKTMKNLVEYKEGASFFGGNSELSSRLESGGTAEVYGLEVLVQKLTGKTTGWIGYTWSKNFRTFQDINNGNPFPYRYDARHDFSIVFNHELNKKIDFSFTWQFRTGNALTLATSKYQVINQNPSFYDDGEFSTAHYYNGRNSYRMASFHKLDVNVNFRKEKKKGTRTWSVGLYNAYSRQNPSFLFYKYDWEEKRTKLYQLSFFPILPSINYSFKFN